MTGATGTDESVGAAAGSRDLDRGSRTARTRSGKPTLARLVVAWLLAVGALLLLVVHLALPISRAATTVSWTPTSPDDTSTPLVLSGWTPSSLVAVAPCPAANWFESSSSQVTVFGTSADPAMRALSLVASPQEVWVRIAGQDLPGLRMPTPPNGPPNCRLRLTYERGDNVITVSIGERTVSGAATWIDPYDSRVQLDGPQVSGLHTSSLAIPGISVTVVTQPAAVTAPPVRYLPAVAAGLMGAVSVALMIGSRPRRARSRRSQSTSRWTSWSGVDWVVLLLLAGSWIVIPTLYDDGWVLTTVREFSNLHYFSDYYANEATPQPLGFWWDLVQSSWMGMTGLPAIALRLPAVLLGLATWWVVRYRALAATGVRGSSRAVLWPAAIVFGAGWSAWLITLRPEPMVALLLAVQIYLTATVARSPGLPPILLSGVTSVLALSAHQTGVSVLAASFAAVPSVVTWWRTVATARQRSALVAGLVALAAILGILLTAWGNLAVWLASRQAFEDGLGHDNLLDEVARIASLNGIYVTSTRRMTVVLLLIGCVTFLVSLSRRQPRSRVVTGTSALLATVGLVLTVSKWPWHYGVVMPAAAVLAGLTGGWLWSSRRKPGLAWRVIGVGLAVAAGGYWSAQSTQPWTESSLAQGRATDLVPPGTSGPLDLGTLGFWVVLGVVASALGAVVARTRGKPVGLLSGLSVFVLLTLATTSIISLRPLVQDTVAAGAMSWVGQSATALAGNTCGLAGTTGYRVPLETNPLPVRAGPSAGVTPAVAQDPGSVDPASPPLDVAERYVAPPMAPASGLVATPWYQIDPGVPGRVWVRTDRGGILAGQVESVDLSGGDLRTVSFSAPLEMPGWRLIELPDGDQPRLSRIAWRPTQSNLVVATGAVTVSRSTSLAELTSIAWVNPSTFLQVPCLRPPSIRTGVVDAFVWSNGFPAILGRSYAFEGTVTEMACTSALPTPERLCATQVQTPASAALTTVETTVVQ